jgi:signal transduction histidine kinase
MYMNARLRWAALAALLVLATLSRAAELPVRQVLMLQSFDRGNLSIDTFTANFRIDLESRVEGPVNFVQVVVGPTGFTSAPEQSVVDYIRSIFVGHPTPDLIVTTAGPASVFARKYRLQLFPDVPLLFASVDQRFLGEAPLGANETAVAVMNDFPAIVDDILRILPRTSRIFMIVGYGPIRDFWRHRLEEQFSRYRGRVAFVWSDELSFPEILRRSSQLPPHSAIFFITLGTDAEGAAYADERVLAELHAAANAPLFAANDNYLGQGIVGGTMLSADAISRSATDVAIRLLNGASPTDVRLPPQLPGQPIFDWRELKRWDIPESRLPPGSLVKFRGPTLWSEYRGTVMAVAGALVLQAILIVGLLLERRARRRAENQNRRNLSLAANISRRETMSALNSSISHELSQPISAMIFNTEALQMIVASRNGASESIDEILADIHADGIRAANIMERNRMMLRSRELQKEPVDLQMFIGDALDLVSHDIHARRIEVSVDRPSTPCIVSGDPVLLQQVFVNLLLNAVDAMAETSLEGRYLTIGIEVRHARVEISVRDTGPGLHGDLVDKLFTPFVTTKPYGVGIGLAIARTIVDAHEGNINARNHPDGGAIFTVILPVGHAHESSGKPAIVGVIGGSPEV